MKRTQIKDFEKIDQAKDLDYIVKDKRTGKRANKKKAKRRKRHYEVMLLKHFKKNYQGLPKEVER
ncbi:MAG TPA: hypothetical protein DIT65_02325 [Cryomorphaceae bacterium]|nr:hypothetical protein [Cryomorphaceae bacterium]|tara:strand:+ start:517 stop:711 length:195 start_codon:yes stop_codon:yes gene_type:complete